MKISKERLLSEAEATGFRTEMLEKAILLLWSSPASADSVALGIRAV